MDKREQIERALYPIIITVRARKDWWRRGLARGLARFVAGALAEELVIECGVEHIGVPPEEATNIRYCHDNRYYEGMLLDGHHGTPGKAIAIVLSLEEE